MPDDALNELDWVVWELFVWDRDERVEPGVGERTKQSMTELAGTLGCVLNDWYDCDAVDGVPYYQWQVRVPQAEHRRRGDDGVPVVVATLQTYLRTQLPPRVNDWTVQVAADESYRQDIGRTLREVHEDLLNPLEVALLGLRRDGAQELEPQARLWTSHESVFAGTYTLWLGKDPDAADCWLYLTAGVWVPAAFWASPGGRDLRRFVRPGSPVLLLPKPDDIRWFVTANTAPFEPRRGAACPSPVGASYRWTGHDGDAVAARVAADLTALLPGLDRPAAP